MRGKTNMPRQADLKRHVRHEMRRTGLSYTQALERVRQRKRPVLDPWNCTDALGAPSMVVVASLTEQLVAPSYWDGR